MQDKILEILRAENASNHFNQNILICSSKVEEGLLLAKKILLHILDKKSVLFLSGGKTPKELYESLAQEELGVGAVALVDERYGEKFHNDSNELMLKSTGFLRIIELLQIPFYPILQSEKKRPALPLGREDTALQYDQMLRQLFATFQKHVAILGIGMDGHTAGLPASASLGLQGDPLRAWIEDLYNRAKDRMVIDYDDKGGPPAGGYKQRITATFLGLSMMDLLIVLVFGEEKKKALNLMFSEGSDEDVPSRFLKRPEIAAKTLLITDLQV